MVYLNSSDKHLLDPTNSQRKTIQQGILRIWRLIDRRRWGLSRPLRRDKVPYVPKKQDKFLHYNENRCDLMCDLFWLEYLMLQISSPL